MGQRGKAHEVSESAKVVLLPRKRYYRLWEVVLPPKRYYRLCERYYRLYAGLQESELDSFPAGQTDLVRAKLIWRRLLLQV